MFAKFLAELKRRHVIRVAGIYTVAAWGAFQVANTIFQTLDFPKWTSTLALAVAVLGLPVVLVVAWIFERTPSGEIVATPDAPEGAAGPRLSRTDVLILSAMVLVAGLVGAQVGGLIGGGKAPLPGLGAPDRSVAVLPFVVFTSAKDAEYFADGLTEEVINSLAQAPDLKVAGRTSVFYFKGKNEDLREVGKKLGVAHVVEGSVRQEGDRLRVTAQLVSVKDGFHLWSNTYDRTMDDAFAIQTEIGEAVAGALKSKLDLKAAPADQRPDPAAYQLEITSRAHLRRRGLEELKLARAGFEKLIAMQPENAHAYAGYAQATITLAQNHLGMDFGEARRVSEAAMEKAIALDPDDSQVWLARATVSRVLAIRVGGPQYFQQLDEALARAVKLNPRNSEALTLLAARQADLGDAALAEATARRAVAVDPLSRSALMALSKALMRTGKLQEAEQKYRSVTEIYPDFAEAKYALAMVLVEQGRLDKAEPWLREVAAAGEDPFVAFQAAWVYINLGLPDDAHKVTVAIKASPGKELGEAGEFAVRGDWAGMLAYGEAQAARSKEPFWPTVKFQAAYMLGRYDQALAALREVRPDLLSGDPGVSVLDLGMPVAVSHILRATGETGQADRLMDKILAATAPVAGQRTVNDWRMARTRVFAERGQVEASLAELEAAEKAGWRTPFTLDSVWLDQDPTMASVRGHPRFKAVMARVRQDLATQRAAVLAGRK